MRYENTVGKTEMQVTNSLSYPLNVFYPFKDDYHHLSWAELVARQCI